MMLAVVVLSLTVNYPSDVSVPDLTVECIEKALKVNNLGRSEPIDHFCRIQEENLVRYPELTTPAANRELCLCWYELKQRLFELEDFKK